MNLPDKHEVPISTCEASSTSGKESESGEELLVVEYEPVIMDFLKRQEGELFVERLAGGRLPLKLNCAGQLCFEEIVQGAKSIRLFNPSAHRFRLCSDSSAKISKYLEENPHLRDLLIYRRDQFRVSPSDLYFAIVQSVFGGNMPEEQVVATPIQVIQAPEPEPVQKRKLSLLQILDEIGNTGGSFIALRKQAVPMKNNKIFLTIKATYLTESKAGKVSRKLFKNWLVSSIKDSYNKKSIIIEDYFDESEIEAASKGMGIAI